MHNYMHMFIHMYMFIRMYMCMCMCSTCRMPPIDRPLTGCSVRATNSRPASQVDADVQPTYVRVKAKKNILQLLLPSEVLADASVAKRSTTTGHLLLKCPKMCPVVVSKAPAEKRRTEREALKAAQMPTPLLLAPHTEPAVDLRPLSTDDSICSIVAKAEQPDKRKATKAYMTPQLGPDYEDEEDVPPLL